MGLRLPHVYIVRHGQTEWSLNGRHTGTTDIPLTAKGEEQVIATRDTIVPNVIKPENVRAILVSPRQRAQKTANLLFSKENRESGFPEFETNEDVAEWDYGAYEGMLTKDIRKQYKEDWYIWTDGCPPGNTPGESPQQMQDRVDRVINKIKALHEECVNHPEGREGKPQDIVIVSHGHFTRCFISRWIGQPVCFGYHLQTDPGALHVLGYQHNTLKEPSLIGLNWFTAERE